MERLVENVELTGSEAGGLPSLTMASRGLAETMLFVVDWNGRETAAPPDARRVDAFRTPPSTIFRAIRTCEGRERVSNTGNACWCCTVVRTGQSKFSTDWQQETEEMSRGTARRERSIGVICLILVGMS